MEDNRLTLRGVRDHIVARLSSKFEAREARAIADIILEEVLHATPVDVALHKDREILPLTVEKFDKMTSRMVDDDEPLQYIIGKTRFYGADIEVNRSTLIPRPETEELVDMIVDRWGERRDLRVVDLCTGSGCIAVSLARVLKFAKVEAIDLSAGALDVARCNASHQGVDVAFYEADLLDWKGTGEYDIIVSNPPYVLDSERSAMQRNVVGWEPEMALFVPDDDPLRFYRPIARLASQRLTDGGRLYLEINPLCVDALQALLRDAGLTDIESHRDMTGRQRFITAQR